MGTSNRPSRVNEIADATGQSRLKKNSVHKAGPIIWDAQPPSRSGITTSPTTGMNDSSAPAATPGSDSGNVISQNAFHAGQPRSDAASSNDSSILSRLA